MSAVSGLTLTISSGANGADITTGNSTFALVSGTPKVDTSWAPGGTRSMRCTTTASANHSGRLDGPSATTRYHAGYIRLWGPAGGAAVIAQVNDGTTAKAQIQRQANGTFRIRNQAFTAVGTVSTPLADDTVDGSDGVYWLTFQITGSTFRARAYLPGGTSPVWDSGNQTYGGGAFDSLVLGLVSAAANTDIGFYGWVADTAVEPSQPGDPAPVVDAGDPQSVKDGKSVTLDSTVTGSTTSVVWDIPDGPSTSSSQFSSTTDDDPTFTPDGGPGAYTLRRTASWAGGSPVSDTVVVTVTPLTAEFAVVAVTASGWTNEGGAASLTEAVTDDDNATAARSPANPSAAVAKLFFDGGLKPASGQPFTVPVRLTGPADSAFVAKLYQHNDSTLVHANSSVDIDTGDAVAGEDDMYDHVISFAAADWASMPDADWADGPVVRIEVST